MMDTCGVRHAVRDAGAALGRRPPSRSTRSPRPFPTSAPSATPARPSLPTCLSGAPAASTAPNSPPRDLGFRETRRPPRHIALHPCGVILPTPRLDRTPVRGELARVPDEPGSDKDDVEALGLFQTDVPHPHAVLGMPPDDEIARTTAKVRRPPTTAPGCPSTTRATFPMIRTTTPLGGCFQIESLGQRELDRCSARSSLRGPPSSTSPCSVPVWSSLGYDPAPSEACPGTGGSEAVLHLSLILALETEGSVVAPRADAGDQCRDPLGVLPAQSDEGAARWAAPRASEEIEGGIRAGAGDSPPSNRDRIWAVLKAFASFGFWRMWRPSPCRPIRAPGSGPLPGAPRRRADPRPGHVSQRLILDDARPRSSPFSASTSTPPGDTIASERRMMPWRQRARTGPSTSRLHPAPSDPFRRRRRHDGNVLSHRDVMDQSPRSCGVSSPASRMPARRLLAPRQVSRLGRPREALSPGR